jgi:sugar phosphate isomerase/epimerase
MTAPMPFAVDTHSYTFSHSIEDTVDSVARAGYVEIELLLAAGHLWPSQIDPEGRRRLRRRLADAGLSVVAVNIPNGDINITGEAPETRAYSLEILSGALRLAADLGAAELIMGPGKGNPLLPGPKEALIARFFSALDSLSDRTRSLGVGLSVENIPFSYIPDVASLVETLDGYGNADIGTVYDIANSYFIGEPLPDALRKQAKRLRLIHVSDTTRRVHRHDAVGKGEVPFEQIPAVLNEIGYTRRPVLEIISRSADQDIAASAEALIACGWTVAQP